MTQFTQDTATSTNSNNNSNNSVDTILCSNININNNDNHNIEYDSNDNSMEDSNFSTTDHQISQQQQNWKTASSLRLQYKSHTKKLSQPPAPRWGHTATRIDSHRMILYGGSNNNNSSSEEEKQNDELSHVFVYNLHTHSWSKPVNCSYSGSSDTTYNNGGKCWHSATYVPSRNLLISFGGEDVESDEESESSTVSECTSTSGKNINKKKQQQPQNQQNSNTTNAPTDSNNNNNVMMVLDTDIMLWYPPACSGVIPRSRSGHTATLLPVPQNRSNNKKTEEQNQILIFGGIHNTKHKKTTWLNTAALLDAHRWKWSTPRIIGNAPRPRSYHTATAVSNNGNNMVVIIGGNDDSVSFGLDTVHVLQCGGGGSNNNKLAWHHMECTGADGDDDDNVIPCRRTGHVAVLLEDQKSILVYGGWDPCSSDDDDNDDVISDTDEEDEVFQDCYILDTETWVWSKYDYDDDDSISSSLKMSRRRVGHTAVLGANGDEIVCFGGRLPGDAFGNDVVRIPVV